MQQAVEPRPTRMPFRSGWTTSCSVRPCSSTSGGARRSGSSWPRRTDRRPQCLARSSIASGPTDRCSRGCPSPWPAGSPPTTWRRRHWSSGPCCRRACSSGWSSSRNWRRGALATRDGGTRSDSATQDLLDQLERGPRPVRELAGPDGRAGLLRRLRSLAERGDVSLEWVLTGAGAGPRYERWIRLRPEGRAIAANLAHGERPPGRPLGPRQVDALAELAASPSGDLPGAELGGRHGTAALAGLVRRGLVDAEVRERPRRPLAARPVGRRGGRPSTSELLPAQADAVERIRASIDARNPRPLLLDGVTGAGKTAIYVEAIGASLDAGRPALVLVPEIALALPLVDRLRNDLDVRIAILHSGLGDGERADEWRRIRAGDVDIVVGTRLAVLAPLADVGVVIVDEEHDAAYKSDRTPRLQARDCAIRLAELAGAALVLGSATPAVDSMGRARSGEYDRVVLPVRPIGAPPHGRDRGPARGTGCRSTGLVVAFPGERACDARCGCRRTGDPRPEQARHGVGGPVP